MSSLIYRRWVDDGRPVDARDNTQKTPLHYAAQWGQEETLDFLIECEANVNAADFIEDTPLHFVSSTYANHPTKLRHASHAQHSSVPLAVRWCYYGLARRVAPSANLPWGGISS